LKEKIVFASLDIIFWHQPGNIENKVWKIPVAVAGATTQHRKQYLWKDLNLLP
jgi:hypothetical protein